MQLKKVVGCAIGLTVGVVGHSFALTACGVIIHNPVDNAWIMEPGPGRAGTYRCVNKSGTVIPIPTAMEGATLVCFSYSSIDDYSRNISDCVISSYGCDSNEYWDGACRPCPENAYSYPSILGYRATFNTNIVDKRGNCSYCPDGFYMDESGACVPYMYCTYCSISGGVVDSYTGRCFFQYPTKKDCSCPKNTFKDMESGQCLPCPFDPLAGETGLRWSCTDPDIDNCVSFGGGDITDEFGTFVIESSDPDAKNLLLVLEDMRERGNESICEEFAPIYSDMVSRGAFCSWR